jgi:hypothetical protein
VKQKYPLATVMPYGPNDKAVTKLVLGVHLAPEAEPETKSWGGTDIVADPKVAREMYQFMRSRGVKTVITATVVMGCPHEEGEDFPDGGDCPFCPFWKGKQGSGTPDTRWANLKAIRVEELGFSYKFWLPL